jgi:predicted permease
MGLFGNISAGLRALMGRTRVEGEMDEELRGFVDASAEDKRRAGLSPEQATRAARVEMGSTNAVKHRIRSAGWETAVENLWMDFRYSVRMLAKSPGFTLVAVTSLALGIGANTAIFTLINGLLLKELPVHSPQELVSFGEAYGGGIIGGADIGESDLFPYRFAVQLQNEPGPFSGICSFASFTLKMSVRSGERLSGPPAQVMTHLVSGNYFSVLGAEMEMGRPLQPSDADAPGRNAVVVVSDHYWREGLSADPNAIGRTITVSGTPFTVVGVANPKFYGVKLQKDPVDIWAPLTMQKEALMRPSLLGENGFYWLHLIGRRNAGTTLSQNQQWVNAQMRNYELAHGGAQITRLRRQEIERVGVKLVSAQTGISDLRTLYGESLRILMAMVGLVLLVACANLANFLLAKAAAREREIATRLALGSGRTRIVRQVLMEALVLAFVGGALGAGLAFAAARVLIRFVMAGVANPTLNAKPDLHVLAFTFGVSLFTGLLFGIAPALRASRCDALPALKSGARTAGASGGARGHVVSRVLVVAQVALSMVLLAGAGLSLRTLMNLQHKELGFDRSNLLLAEFNGNFGGSYKPEELPGLYQQIIARMRALPGVANAAFSGDPPLSHGIWDSPIAIHGYVAQPKEDMLVLVDQVTAGYFDTLGIRIIAGRAISDRDVAGASHTVVVNQTFATRFFPRGGAIGHRITFDDPSVPGDWEIVGVVADAKYNTPREGPQRMIYLSVLQLTGGNAYARWLQVKTKGDPAQSTGMVRAALAELEPNLPIWNMRTVDEQIDTFTESERLISDLSSLFSGLTVLLAGIGLYGVMSYSVVRRTNEIGVRIALGAQSSNVLWMVLRESLVLLGIGLALGLPLSLGGLRLLQSQLFELSASDPLTMAGSVLIISGVTLLAAWLPARRATKVDPMVALRCE